MREAAGTRGALEHPTMNAITFGTKRAFHAFLKVTRDPLEALADGLTAARFDMMYVIWKGGGALEWGGLWQSRLRKVLGVCGPVVSRMLRSLELLGWVVRRRSQEDRRQVEVSLTPAGLACIRQAFKVMKVKVAKLVYKAICFGREEDRDEQLVHMAALESYHDSMRKPWGDTATLYYRWGHPDD